MSRGGRGGGRGGMLKGVSWDYDPTQTIDSTPTELFPEYTISYSTPQTPSEQRAVRLYKDLREQIHHGPLYTKAPARDPHTAPKVFSEAQANADFEVKGRVDTDPFVGVPTYSMKYDRKERAIPVLSGRPFIQSFFPPELHSTLTGADGLAARNALSRSMRKKLILSHAIASPGTTATTATTTDEDRRRALLEKLDGAAEEEGEEDEEGGEEEEEDYNYEDDEEEMGGDYDAEQYFDDGGEGGEEEEGGGGDDY